MNRNRPHRLTGHIIHSSDYDKFTPIGGNGCLDEKRPRQLAGGALFSKYVTWVYLMFLRSIDQFAILLTPGSEPVNIVLASLSPLSHHLSHAPATFA